MHMCKRVSIFLKIYESIMLAMLEINKQSYHQSL